MRYVALVFVAATACGSPEPSPQTPVAVPSAPVASASAPPTAEPASSAAADATPPAATSTTDVPRIDTSSKPPAPDPNFRNTLTPEQRKTYDKLTPEQRKKYEELAAQAAQMTPLAALSGGSKLPPDPLPPIDLSGAARPTAPQKPGTPTGDAVFGGATASVPVPNADRVLAGLRPRFRACYLQGLSADPSMAGKVVITAKVDGKGVVVAADVGSNNGMSAAAASCLAAVVKRAQFDPPAVASGSTLNIPLTFVQTK